MVACSCTKVVTMVARRTSIDGGLRWKIIIIIIVVVVVVVNKNKTIIIITGFKKPGYFKKRALKKSGFLKSPTHWAFYKTFFNLD